VHPSGGRCNRENNCGYHYTPKQYFQDNKISTGANCSIIHKPKNVLHKRNSISYIQNEVFKESLKEYEENNFVEYLISLVGYEIASKTVGRYFIGTSKHWSGSTVFWQIDKTGKVRTGKIIQYNPTTGKRVRNVTPPVYWVHKNYAKNNFNLSQCLFGEHLLEDKTKPVAIVESEKTAIIASIYLPHFIWVAVGSSNNLNAKMCGSLVGRNVVLFPDLSIPIENKESPFDKWSKVAKELSGIANFKVSTLLELKANFEDRKAQLDIADFLVRFKLKDFFKEKLANPAIDEPKVKPNHEVVCESPSIVEIEKAITRENWTNEIDSLESFFSNVKLTTPINLYSNMEISDVSKFVFSHISILRNYNGNKNFRPYFDRLIKLQSIIQSNNLNF
jgi:hypothetical protein